MIDFTESGRMISLSKSLYRLRHPGNTVIFNANILTKKRGKVWHGDIDITDEIAELQRLAAELDEEIWVLREMDARFSTAKEPNWDKFVVRIEPKGLVIHATI